VSKQGEEDGEKEHHLTRKLMDTSAGVEEVGGGRKDGISAGGEDEEVVPVDDFELDSLCASVEEIQNDEEKFLVALAW
jgi:hypothetical protein